MSGNHIAIICDVVSRLAQTLRASIWLLENLARCFVKSEETRTSVIEGVIFTPGVFKTADSLREVIPPSVS